jgi:hypothetical protein
MITDPAVSSCVRIPHNKPKRSIIRKDTPHFTENLHDVLYVKVDERLQSELPAPCPTKRAKGTCVDALDGSLSFNDRAAALRKNSGAVWPTFDDDDFFTPPMFTGEFSPPDF